MTQPISVVCPSCDSVLKVTKPSLIGKRVACPSCKKPVLIQAPVAAKQDETPKRKETATPARAARAGGDDLDLVLLADDDDPFDRRAPKAVLAPSEKPPAKKPRSSAVWKKMEEAETSEFEAMLTDTDEPDEPTEELPLSA
jgi:hypothetical protein